MPHLVAPTVAAAASLRAAAIAHPDETLPEYQELVSGLPDADLPAYVDRLLADTREGTARPDGYVPSTHLWWVDGTTYLGRVHIRHRLTPTLRRVGGHIGYYVVPPFRGQGHATAMFAAALPIAAALGVDCALVTCDVANSASRKVIEGRGGLLEDEAEGKLRFWVPTT